MAFQYTHPLALRIVQGILAIICLGLTAYVANSWSYYWYIGTPSSIAFMLFTSVWTLLALVYLIVAPMKFPTAAHKFAVLAVEALTMLFWFAAFIAVAVLVSGICYGHVCDSGKAAAAFGAFAWLTFAATTTLAAMHVFRTQNSRDKTMDPQMQVHQGV